MTMQTLGRPIEILLVEDNPGDVRLTLELFKDCKLQNKIHVTKDGVEAIAFLRRTGAYTQAVRPDVIFLDLNLPKKNGREVLAEIKEDPELKRIPVVVLTGSQAEEDIVKSYNLHANCYISKPVDLDQFVNVIKTIQEFWFSIVKLPKS
jgi:two-component system, chemotaxis family, response regulator Rcp1